MAILNDALMIITDEQNIAVGFILLLIRMHDLFVVQHCNWNWNYDRPQSKCGYVWTSHNSNEESCNNQNWIVDTVSEVPCNLKAKLPPD